MARVLILTAGFGEGHNTAARSLAAALQLADPGGEARVFDPLAEACPRLTTLARAGYLTLINHFPAGWNWIYKLADRAPHSGRGRRWLAPASRRLAAEVAAFRPDAVATTYPLYTGFWQDLFPPPSAAPCPFHTVVTDSLTINKVWLAGRSDSWCVTDHGTAANLENRGLPGAAIHVTGFPVAPRFSTLPRELEPPAGPGDPLRILFFPIASRRHTRRMLAALAGLPDSPAWSLTAVLGKQKDRLRSLFETAIAAGRLPPETNLIGWTDQIPELLASHHVVLGKAGGATVHEARTAARPMLVHYVVPGQEEGNVRLLESCGGGRLLRQPGDLANALADWTRDGFAGWRQARAALAADAPPDPAARVARVVLASLNPDLGRKAPGKTAL
jgi:processive 1,2-diacylglycerol beta-glucosyltransferase